MTQMNEIYDSWRSYVGAEGSTTDQAKQAAMEHFSAQGLAPGWQGKAIRQVVELVEQGLSIDDAIAQVEEELWNQQKNGNLNFIQTARYRFGYRSYPLLIYGL